MDTKKVLYVEDEAILRDEIALILQEIGYEVQTAEDGMVGWSMLQQYRPDVVITDIKMPNMTGIELLQDIRKSKLGQLPVIVMSGFVDRKLVDQVHALDVSAYISKPFELDNLLDTIERVVAFS